jgi:hypothetical protein
VVVEAAVLVVRDQQDGGGELRGVAAESLVDTGEEHLAAVEVGR